MTLPASFPLSMSQVATELGLTLPLSMNHAWVLALANKGALPVSFSDLLGKSGSFNGLLTGNNIGGSTVQVSFANAPMFNAGLNVCTVTPALTQTLLDFNSVPSYAGNLKFTNTTTGVSVTLSNQGGAVWTVNSAPANLIRQGITDNFTVFPSN